MTQSLQMLREIWQIHGRTTVFFVGIVRARGYDGRRRRSR